MNLSKNSKNKLIYLIENCKFQMKVDGKEITLYDDTGYHTHISEDNAEKDLADFITRLEFKPTGKEELVEEDDHLMSVAEFIEDVKNGYLNDDDGIGCFSDGKKIFSRNEVSPSDVKDGKLDTKYSHIVWYNK